MEKVFLDERFHPVACKGRGKGAMALDVKMGGDLAIREGKKILILRFISEGNLFHVSSIFANSKYLPFF